MSARQKISRDLDDVSIRKFRKSDIPLLAELANNKKISNNLRDGFPHPYTLEDAESFIAMYMNQDPATVFAIEWQGKYVGNIGLAPGKDVYRRSAEIGYFIGEPYWNKGIATRAVELMTEYGFNVLKLARIHTGVFAYNPASMRVLEKNGYRKEGVFREAICKNGRLWDEHRYAILISDNR
jgi:RimJ/RimL family protein N-acetyltransferase